MNIRYIFLVIFLVIYLFSMPLLIQAEVAPDAVDNLAALLNNPALVRPAEVTRLERSWFNSKLDAHVFTDQASVEQIAAVLTDIENFGSTFNGRNTRLRASNVSREDDETIADFTSVTVAVVRFSVNYRAVATISRNTNNRFTIEFLQVDGETNRSVRNFSSIYHVEEVMIGGEIYTYIRISSINDTNPLGLGWLPISSMIKRYGTSTKIDLLNMLIETAKTR